MTKQFEIVFLDDAFEFLSSLDKKHYEKIIFNIRKAQTDRNPELFKKLKDESTPKSYCPRITRIYTNVFHCLLSD